MKSKFKIFGLIGFVLVLAVTMTACDSAMDSGSDITEDIEKTGDLNFTVNTEEIQVLDNGDEEKVETASTIKNRFDNYQVKAELIRDGDAIHESVESVDYKDLEENNVGFKFTDVEVGNWEIKVTVLADYNETNDVEIAEGNQYNVTVEEAKSTRVDTIEVNLLDGRLTVKAVEIPDDAKDDEITVEVYSHDQADGESATLSEDGTNVFSDLPPRMHIVEVSWEDSGEETHTKKPTIMILPNIERNIDIYFYDGEVRLKEGEIDFNMPLREPEGLELDEDYNLKWNEVGGAVSYNVVRKDVGSTADYEGERSFELVENVTERSLDLTQYHDGTNNFMYHYAVVAVDEDGQTSDYSETLDIGYAVDEDGLNDALGNEDISTIIVANGTNIQPDSTILIERSDITLKSESKHGATIQGEGDLIRIKADEVTIDGFKILENPNNASRAGIVPGGKDIIIQNNVFEGFNNHIAWDRAGLSDTQDTIIKNNEFRNVGEGNAEKGSAVAQTEGVSGIFILENEFYNNRNDIGLADDAINVTIKDNHFNAGDSDRYISNRNSGDPESEDILALNTFNPEAVIANLDADNREDIVTAPVNGEALNINSRDRYDGTDAIKVAVENANSDHTILVGPGTYDGGIGVNTEGLTIQSAEGPENTIVLTGDHGDTSPDLGFSIRAQNVTVSGIGIEHPDNDADGIGILLSTGSNNTTIENNRIVNNADAKKGRNGVYMADGADGHVVTVHDNYFSNWTSAVAGTENTQPTITENEFQNNRNSIGLAESAENIVIEYNEFYIDDVGELEGAFNSDARYISNRGLTVDEAEAIVDSSTGNTFEPDARFVDEDDKTSHIVPEGSGAITD